MKLNNIKGLLIDLEGVLYVGDKIIEGSVETVKYLNNIYKIKYLTNTTTASRNSVFKKLIKMGLQLDVDDIFSPSIAVNDFLHNNKIKRIYLLANKNLEPDFNNFTLDDQFPEAVILGDVYKNFNWYSLNKVFELITNNEAMLIALHKNKYCKRNGRIALDLGPFVQALEYAASIQSVIIGKPDKKFFNLAIDSLNLKKNEIAMVGDDILSDIAGAKNNGLISVQVKTGKYQPQDEGKEFIQPDIRIDSIASLPSVINVNLTNF
jgi:HAD superfamily hydrolase (TIGR01458 family)